MLTMNESELLSGYIDGELNGKELALVQTNLNGSPEWREELERLKSARSLSLALPRPVAPADFLDAIAADARRAAQPRPLSAWLLNPFSAPLSYAGSLAAAAAFVFLIGRTVFVKPAAIPLDMLLAAHSRSVSTPLLQDEILAASDYSQRIRNHAPN